MSLRFLVPAILAGLTTLLSAQAKVQTLPAGYLTTNGNQANSWPWNNTNVSGHRCMWVYDSSHINFAGPVLISKLRWRAHTTTGSWTGGTHPNVTINMSTCPVDYASATATFANNHGKDLKTIFKGTATVTPSTHANGRWYVEIKLATPFVYDPTKGDLTIDYIRPAGTVGRFVACDTLRSGANLKTTRIQSHNSSTSPTGSCTVNSYAIITEVTWMPASGLYAGFDATPKIGAAPLKVQFTDQTFSSATGGVKTWAWDFNGDSKVDSTIQNPMFVYPTAGKTAQYTVTLTSTDGVHPTSTTTSKNFITVDPKPIAGFTATPTSGPAPLMVQFTDTSVGAGTWAWDFNGDSKVDSTIQNPKFVYTPGFYDVSLSVSNAGGSNSITKKGYISALGANQTLQTLPKGLLTTEGNSSTSYLWGRYNSALGHRVQYCYDKTYISSPAPVIIRALWFRCNAGTYTWTGGTFNNVNIKLSTCPVAYTAIGTTFASNHGADVKTCFNGNVTVKPQTTPSTNSPQTWCVQVNLTTPFFYDPAKGDLLLDFTMPGPLPTTRICYALDAETSTNNNSRYVYNYSNATSPTGSGPYTTTPVIGVIWEPAGGLYASFDATPKIGSSPLKVNFTDTSYSSTTGGVTSWAWDFNGDSKIDSTVQNPPAVSTPVSTPPPKPVLHPSR